MVQPNVLQSRIQALGPWFHNLVLDGIETAPEHFLGDYQVDQLHERFDLVIFMGVLYHLRHPLLALDTLYEHVTLRRHP